MKISLTGRVNFERSPSDKTKIRFSTHIHELNRLFSALDSGDSQLYVIVDEMNLSTKTSDDYNRDIFMIRDLIIAIERFNAISKNSHGNVRVIGAIRNEVINSVQSRGKEINKAIESYGIPIDWTQYSEDELNHPLIRLLINYLKLSELEPNLTHKLTESEIYYHWVERAIYNAPSYDIIRNNTLYRPRHVVRLLNLMKLLCGKEQKISTSTFNAIKRRYSSECWAEITEELSLSYSTKELILIKDWLTGMPFYTTKQDMYNKALRLWSSVNNRSQSLLERFDDILRDLYQAGVIGTINRMLTPPKHRWYFRGDEAFMSDQTIQIHRIFQPVLSTIDPKQVINLPD